MLVGLNDPVASPNLLHCFEAANEGLLSLDTDDTPAHRFFCFKHPHRPPATPAARRTVRGVSRPATRGGARHRQPQQKKPRDATRM